MAFPSAAELRFLILHSTCSLALCSRRLTERNAAILSSYNIYNPNTTLKEPAFNCSFVHKVEYCPSTSIEVLQYSLLDYSSTCIGLLQYSYWITPVLLLDYSSTSIGLLNQFDYVRTFNNSASKSAAPWHQQCNYAAPIAQLCCTDSATMLQQCSKYYTSIRLIQTLAKNNVQTIHFQRSFGSLHSEGLFPVEVLKLRLKYFGSEYPQAYATSLTGIDVDSNR